MFCEEGLEGRGDVQVVLEQERLQAAGVLDFTGQGLAQLAFALAQVGQFDLDAGQFLTQRLFANGGGVGAQGYLGIHQRLAGVGQPLGQLVALEFQAAEVEPLLVELQAVNFEFGQVHVGLRAAADDAVGDAPATVGLALLVQLLDVIQRGDALAHVGGQRLKVAHRLQLVAQRLHVHQVLVQQVVAHKVADVGQWAEGHAFGDLGGEGLLELPQAVEQVEAVVLEAGKDLGARQGRQRKVLDVAAKGTTVKDLPLAAEEPGIVEPGVVDDKVGDVGRAPVLVGVHDGPVDEIRLVGIAVFQRDDGGGVAAQEALAFGAQFAAHVTGERAPAAAHGGLVVLDVPLPADQRELEGVEDGGLARAIDADKVSGALAGDSGVFEQVPVDETNASELFHGRLLVRVAC